MYLCNNLGEQLPSIVGKPTERSLMERIDRDFPSESFLCPSVQTKAGLNPPEKLSA